MILSQCRIGYCIIYIVIAALIEYLTVLLEYLDLLQTRWQGTASIWEVWALLGMPFLLRHCLKLIYLMFHIFQLPIILILCLCVAYNSGIILAKIVTYYS